jgi:hypothetical protein
MKYMMRVLRAVPLLCVCALAWTAAPAHSQAAATVTINGAVLDPSGASIPHATLHLHSARLDRDATADDSGHFTVTVPPATYDVKVEATGFRNYARTAMVIAPGRTAPLTITLEIATDTEQVEVTGDAELSTDASANKTALVFKEDKLDTFSDDPAIMQQQLMALGGIDPTDPPQLYIDGFSGGQMPPKNTIREIRINQNPFSAQYDQFGNSRIEIFTKPGTNQLHGGLDGNFGNSVLNSRSPYTNGVQPGYNTNFLNGNLSGPLGKHSSFFFSVRRFDQANNAIINAVTLDANLAVVNFTQAVPNPSVNQNYSLRFDRQFGGSDTFIARYTYGQNDLTNFGVGQFVLPSQGAFSNTRTQTLQLTDTHLFSAKVVLDAGFQYIRTRQRQDANSSAVSRVVQGAFSDGGNPAQSLHDNQDRFEFQGYLSIAHGTHFIRTGVRYRLIREANLANAGYNGQFIFPNITAYQITEQDLKKGYNDQAIRADCVTTSTGHVCGGATQFSIAGGIPTASMLTGDVGVYGEDEWKMKPNFSLIYGLRLENETGIPMRLDLAPRVGFAWSLVRDPKSKKPPVAVIRGGLGIFYQRFPANNILQSIRQNGTTQRVYYVTDPSFYCDPAINSTCVAPTVSAVSGATATPPTIYEINPYLHSPQQIQGNISAEHSFGKYGNIAMNYFQRRSLHGFESRNINAPLPGTYDPSNPNSGVRPLGGTQNIYQYSSDGISNGHTFAMNTNLNLSSKLSLFAFFAAGHQETDTHGGFPSNSYDLGADAGRPAGYSPRQYVWGANGHPGKDFSFNVFFLALSGQPFNITTGTDLNGDTQYNDRPAFATDLTRPSVVRTPYGDFDTAPLPGQTIIPINYANGPGTVYLEISAGKNFRFGPRVAAPAGPGGPPPPASAVAKGGKPAPLPLQKYRINFGVEADNPLNHVNRGAPIGVLSSSLFGQSNSLNNRFNGGGSANRTITFHTGFYF